MLKMLAEIITEVATSLFSNESIDLEETATYRYWENLNYEDQYYYFTNNEYLRDYMKNDYYAGDRYMTAKHVAKIAYKLNKDFTNKYDRY